MKPAAPTRKRAAGTDPVKFRGIPRTVQKTLERAGDDGVNTADIIRAVYGARPPATGRQVISSAIADLRRGGVEIETFYTYRLKTPHSWRRMPKTKKGPTNNVDPAV